MNNNRTEELLDELFDSVLHLHHYLGGMLDDLKNKKYNLAEVSADMTVIDNSSVGDILNELYELSYVAELESAYEDDEEEVTTEMPVTVDVWSHFGASK